MQTEIGKSLGKNEVMSWEPMTNPPQKSAHYAVMHRGRVFGTAYYYAGDFKTSGMVLGWNQLPDFGPTHWLDSGYIVQDAAARFWPEKKQILKAQAVPAKKVRLFVRLWRAVSGAV